LSPEQASALSEEISEAIDNAPIIYAAIGGIGALLLVLPVVLCILRGKKQRKTRAARSMLATSAAGTQPTNYAGDGGDADSRNMPDRKTFPVPEKKAGAAPQGVRV